MRAASEQEIAYAMMRFWGGEAAKLAFHYALEYEDGVPHQAARWRRVHDLIRGIRANEGLAQTGQGLRVAVAASN